MMTRPLLALLLLAGCQDYHLTAKETLTNLTGDETAFGRVCDPSGGGWVAGALVYAVVDGERVQTTTDGDGRFALTLPDGEHTLYVEKGSYSAQLQAWVVNGRVDIEAVCLDADTVTAAVVSGEYDQVEDILTGMGVDHTLYNGVNRSYLQLLRDPQQLAEYDVVFLNCGVNEAWQEHAEQIGENLTEYLRAGGSVYASDWAYGLVEATRPGAVNFYGDDELHGDALWGMSGRVDAQVLDPAMQQVIGASTARLRYDMDAWALIDSTNDTVTTLIQGEVRADAWGGGGGREVRPLAVRLNVGDGQLLFTTFHQEGQPTEHMQALLEEIVLSL